MVYCTVYTAPPWKCRLPQRKSVQGAVLGETNVIPASHFKNLWFQLLHAHYYCKLSCRNQNYRPMHIAPSLTSFLQRQHKYMWFSVFPNFRKVCKFAASIKRPKAKSVSVSGGVATWFLTGNLPLDPTGGSTHQTSRYRLAHQTFFGGSPNDKFCITPWSGYFMHYLPFGDCTSIRHMTALFSAEVWDLSDRFYAHI